MIYLPIYLQKGLKQEKYFTFKTENVCVVSIYGSDVSVLDCVDCTEVDECLVGVRRDWTGLPWLNKHGGETGGGG